MKKNPIPRLVRKVKPSVMDGDTELERTLNAMLTARFILTKNVPSDECLDEARMIIEIVKLRMEDLF